MEWLQAFPDINPLLIPTCMKFWFISFRFIHRKFYFPTRCMQCTQNIPIVKHSFITLSNYAAPNFCSFLHLPVTSCRLGPYILLNILFYRLQFVLNDCMPITEIRWIMLLFSSSDIRRFWCTPSTLRLILSALKIKCIMCFPRWTGSWFSKYFNNFWCTFI